MNAVVLVGGGGTRLRPLTYAVSKPLIPVVNRPLVAHILTNLQRHGVRRVVLAASASDRSIEDTIGDGAALGLEVTYCYETTPLGSGLAVKQAARGFTGPFFVCNGDVITDLNLTAMAERHTERQAILSIFLAPVEDPTAFGVAELGEADRIVRFVEKPALSEAPSNWANAGTWIFEPAVLDHISDERMDRSLEQLVFPSLIGEGLMVQGFASTAYWMDVGTSERYLQLHSDILNGLVAGVLEADPSSPILGDALDLRDGVEIGARVLIGPGCAVHEKARIGGPSVLGAGCEVQTGSTIERSVLWQRVLVGPGARIRDSILGEGCQVGAGATVEGAVLANGARVEPGVTLSPGARLEPGEVAA